MKIESLLHVFLKLVHFIRLGKGDRLHISKAVYRLVGCHRASRDFISGGAYEYDRLSRVVVDKCPPLVQPTLTEAATPPTRVVMWDGGGMKSSGGNLSYPCGPHERRGGARSSTDLRDAESR